MAAKGGEEPPAKGSRFDDSVYHLLDKSGYRIPKRHESGKDFVAEPPKPTAQLLPPLFAPRGRTIFEAKAGKASSLRTYAKKLKQKVTRQQRADRSHSYSGVIVTEDHISDSTKVFLNRKYGISVWDIRTIMFLASRIYRTRQLTRLERRGGLNKPIEMQLDTWSTGQWGTRSFNQATQFLCTVYYQHPFNQLDSERFTSIMRKYSRVLNRNARGITNKTYASLEVYSLPGYTDDLTKESRDRVLSECSSGKVIFDLEDTRIHRFETAPWAFLVE